MQEKTEQVSLSDYGATPEDKATFNFLAPPQNSRAFCRSSVYRFSRTQKISTEQVAVPVNLLGNTSIAFRGGLGTRYRHVLNAFTLSTKHRRVPKEVITDRGTYFAGVVGELKKLVSQLHRQKLGSKTVELRVTRKFNPQALLHFGGAQEVMVKAAKKATYAVVRDRDVTNEELITVFAGMKSLLNSRPLTYQSVNDGHQSASVTLF